MEEHHEKLLVETSRTFAVPILKAPKELKDVIGSAYLSMRAIDEIEDNLELSRADKCILLRGIAKHLIGVDGIMDRQELMILIQSYADYLHEVSIRLVEIVEAVPIEVRNLVFEMTSAMAKEMADWVELDWEINTEKDLDAYTFTVAGRVGILLSKIWHWYDGTVCDEHESISFGRALQSVNIIRNRTEDLERGVDFFPADWDMPDMIHYARRQIGIAEQYMIKLEPGGPVYQFCIIPLSLAKASLDVIEKGREKLTRLEVNALISSLDQGS